MIPDKVQALLDFIDFLDKNKNEYITKYIPLCNELQDLDRRRSILKPLENYKEKRLYDDLQKEIENKFLATIACKAAVKAHMVLTKEEVESLMDELLKLTNPFTCPHGRPTVIKMSKYEIERKFERK